MLEEAFAALVSQVVKGPREVTLGQLVALLCLDANLGLLGQIALMREKLKMYSLELLPDLDKGELDTPRIMRFKEKLDAITAEDIRTDIEFGETEKREFKSTLLFDLKKKQYSPELNVTEYRSYLVLFSALKTIAAFLNSNGGNLYIGVSDKQELLGIENDFSFGETCDPDKWQLYLRDVLKSRFKDGAAINDYVHIAIRKIDNAHIANIRVTARNRLSFLNKEPGGEYVLFRRQGNRTEQLPITEIEEYLRTRWQGSNLP